jgi:hypothetical protein
VAVDPARRSALLGLKLNALVRDHLGEGVAAPGTFAGGAALVRESTAWVLLEDQPGRRLGGALAWALQQGATAVAVVAEEATGVLARRAEAFALPVSVWRVDDRALVRAAPEALPPPAGVDPAVVPLVDLIVAGGAEPVVEHGVLAGEVRGLEVCRAVVVEGVPRLEVGVGQADREAFQILHGDEPTVEALADVVRRVAAHRAPGAAPHPLQRLGAERLLRWRLMQDPSAVGAVALAPAQPPLPRPNLKDPVPCVATGQAGDGTPLLAVCSVGVDLDLVPFASDVQRGQPDARVVLAVPQRDDHPVTRRLAALLKRPVDVVPIAPAA